MDGDLVLSKTLCGLDCVKQFNMKILYVNRALRRGKQEQDAKNERPMRRK